MPQSPSSKDFSPHLDANPITSPPNLELEVHLQQSVAGDLTSWRKNPPKPPSRRTGRNKSLLRVRPRPRKNARHHRPSQAIRAPRETRRGSVSEPAHHHFLRHPQRLSQLGSIPKGFRLLRAGIVRKGGKLPQPRRSRKKRGWLKKKASTTWRGTASKPTPSSQAARAC